jgi:hypothetical protein
MMAPIRYSVALKYAGVSNLCGRSAAAPKSFLHKVCEPFYSEVLGPTKIAKQTAWSLLMLPAYHTMMILRLKLSVSTLSVNKRSSIGRDMIELHFWHKIAHVRVCQPWGRPVTFS